MSVHVEMATKPIKSSKLTKVIGVLFLSVGLILLAVAVSYYFYTASFKERAIETRGEVVQLIRNQDSYKPLVIFTDNQGNQVEYVPNFSSNPPAYAVGEEVVVFYDPQNPHSAMLDGIASYFVLLISGGMGFVFTLVGVIVLVVSRRGKGATTLLNPIQEPERKKAGKEQQRTPTIRR